MWRLERRALEMARERIPILPVKFSRRSAEDGVTLGKVPAGNDVGPFGQILGVFSIFIPVNSHFRASHQRDCAGAGVLRPHGWRISGCTVIPAHSEARMSKSAGDFVRLNVAWIAATIAGVSLLLPERHYRARLSLRWRDWMARTA